MAGSLYNSWHNEGTGGRSVTVSAASGKARQWVAIATDANLWNVATANTIGGTSGLSWTQKATATGSGSRVTIWTAASDGASSVSGTVTSNGNYISTLAVFALEDTDLANLIVATSSSCATVIDAPNGSLVYAGAAIAGDSNTGTQSNCTQVSYSSYSDPGYDDYEASGVFKKTTTATGGSITVGGTNTGGGCGAAIAVPAAAGGGITASWSSAVATASVSMLALGPILANWSTAVATASASSMTAVTPVFANWSAAASSTATASMSGLVSSPVTDNFNRSDGTYLTTPWSLGFGSQGFPVIHTGRATVRGGSTGGRYRVYYNQTIDHTAQFAEVTVYTYNSNLFCGLSDSYFGYMLMYTYDEGADVTSFSMWTSMGGRVPGASTYDMSGNLGGRRLRFTCAGRTAWVDVDGVRVYSCAIPEITAGYPGFEIYHDGSLTGNFYYGGVDDFYCGNAQIPSTADWNTAVATATASMSKQVPSSANWLAATSTASVPSWGMPVPSTSNWVGATALTSAQWSGLISRNKDPNLYPTFAAFGATKGRMTVPDAKRIGTSKGIGQGDRVFLNIAHANLLGSGSVAKAWLFLTPVSVMSTDYNATVHPSGTLFNVKPVTSAVDLASGSWDGMAATLGSTLQSITAKPTWLSGQLAYDGVTQGNPINPLDPVDITSAYNDALTSGDLNLCLECALSNIQWECELFGNEIPTFRPRIEVHYAGETVISLTDLDTAEPGIAVTNPGGTTVEIAWGYDEQCTPQGGVFKYANTQVEGLIPTNPGKFPMLESSMRVHVEVRVDHGAPGIMVYTRTFKTPQVTKPAARTKSFLFTDWLDVRGPTPGCSMGYGQNWLMLVKRDRPVWTANTDKNVGDSVTSNGNVYYCRVAGRTGSTAPSFGSGTGALVAAQEGTDGTVTWRYSGAGGASGVGWDLFRATSYLDSFEPIHWVGSVEPNMWVNQAKVIPFPSGLVNSPGSGNPWIAAVSADMHIDAVDVGDPVLCDMQLLFLSSHQVVGGYEIRLNMYGIGYGSDLRATYDWGVDGNNDDGYGFQGQVTIATVTNAPDLRHLSAIGRGQDWRVRMYPDRMAPYYIAFVADGNLKIYEATTTNWTDSVTSWVPLIDTATITQVISHAAPTATKVTTFWTRTWGKNGATVVAVTQGSGDPGLIYIRTPDVFAQPTNGGATTRTVGTWAAANGLVTTTPAFLRVWSAERALSNMDGEVPDGETGHIAFQRYDGTVGLLRHDGDYTSGCAMDINPDADWDVSVTWNRTVRAVKRWPPTTNYTAIRHDAHGGVTLLGYTGANLLATTIRDDLRVSGETTLTLPATITDLFTGDFPFWEGEYAPIITKHSDGCRLSLVMTSMDISRLDLPNLDQVLRFRSGKLTKDSFVYDSPDIHTPGLVHLPGHNVFSMKWSWDEYGWANNGGMGIMNHVGWHYWSITGCKGERAKIIIHHTPAFGGMWKNGVLYPTENTQPWQPEVAGGTTWMTLLAATWFYTYDAPETGNRKWRRLWETDYVLDGEAIGGAYVLCTPVFTKDRVWISHDPIYDVPSFKGDFQRWKNNPNVKWANSTGELLDPATGQPLSQVATMPQW